MMNSIWPNGNKNVQMKEIESVIDEEPNRKFK
jgi:hypothetical protein